MRLFSEYINICSTYISLQLQAPAKPARKSVAKKPTETAQENSFVTGDLFDFNGTVGESPLPRGPMTRSRRSSMYVAPVTGLVTSTARKSVTKKSKTSSLASVMETPTAEESYVQTELKIASKVIFNTYLFEFQSEEKIKVKTQFLTF